MRMEDIREMAKALGVRSARMKKTELIRAVQIAEGNFPCFATASGYCDQLGCAFREDCLSSLQGQEGEA